MTDTCKNLKTGWAWQATLCIGLGNIESHGPICNNMLSKEWDDPEGGGVLALGPRKVGLCEVGAPTPFAIL